MSNQPGSKRPYNSTRRQAQARQTRLQIVEAARRLFIEHGYTGTTLEAIAHAAGVAVETIYATFGNKRTILSQLVSVSVVGDDEPVPLLKRPHIASAQDETDQHRLIQSFAHHIYEIMVRMSPIFALLRAAAQTEPDIAVLLDKVLQDRLQGMTFFVEQLARIGPLREGTTIPHAAECVWALSSGEVFHLLTVDRGWQQEQYVQWLADAVTRMLLP